MTQYHRQVDRDSLYLFMSNTKFIVFVCVYVCMCKLSLLVLASTVVTENTWKCFLLNFFSFEENADLEQGWKPEQKCSGWTFGLIHVTSPWRIYISRTQKFKEQKGESERRKKSNLFSHFPSAPSFSCSWWVVSLIWRQTSSSRTPRASAVCWDCWSTATPAARRKSGACSPPSCARASATCKRAPRWASSIRCCPKWAWWTTWLQVRWCGFGFCSKTSFCSQQKINNNNTVQQSVESKQAQILTKCFWIGGKWLFYLSKYQKCNWMPLFL